MAVDLNEIKINVRSLLTSSQKSVSILQLQKDYREQEGCNLPYRSLGYSSVIELLQNMTDVLTVPPNPNESSMLSLVVGEKTNHLRMLVVKQKSNTKRKKVKSNMNSRLGYHSNRNGNNTFSGSNFYNKRMPTKTNNYTNNIFQNPRSDYRSMSQSTRSDHRSSNSSISQLNQSSSSSSKSYSNLSRNGLNQNTISSTGYVTDQLRYDIERYILENRMLITLDNLKEIVKKHPDYSVLEVKSMEDLKDRVKGFLNINDKSVSLKNTLHSKTNMPVIHHNTDVQIRPLRLSDANQLYTNSLSSKSAISQINSDKNVINSKLYEWNDQNIASDLYTRLSIEFQKDTPHSKYQNDNNYETNRSTESLTEYIDICKNQSMVRQLEDSFYDTVKNSDTAKTNLRKHFNTGLVNEKKSTLCSITMSGINFSNNSNSFLHSTPNKNNNDKISLNENQCIPEVLRSNISKIFKVYCNGVNIENFKLIYIKLYHSLFDPIEFGFISIKQMLKALDQIIEIRNNVLYKKKEFTLCESADFKNDNICLMSNIYLNHQTISTNIEQPTLSFDQGISNAQMLLVETYNPSLFYLQFCYKIVELERLMIQMQYVYTTENKGYIIKPEQILPGSFYATSYTSFLNKKQWFRVQVLREVNSTTVEVMHVDYGTIDYIPKTELRFLDSKFCSLPCQAIHCCLTGYNELDSIAPEVTKAFLEIIHTNKQVLVMVDDHFILSNQCQILHVTLFQNKSYGLQKKLENINNELTIWHLKR